MTATKDTYRAVKLSDDDWTTVLLSMESAEEADSMDYEGMKRYVDASYRVRQKIQKQLGRKAG